MQINTVPNSTYPKVAVQWLNQALYFYQRFCLVDSESFRNRHLRVAAKRRRRHRQHRIGKMVQLSPLFFPKNRKQKITSYSKKKSGRYSQNNTSDKVLQKVVLNHRKSHFFVKAESR